MDDAQPKITHLESPDDLELLVRGDLVQIILQNEPLWKHDEEEHLAAYHGRSVLDHLQFLVPIDARYEYIVRYQVRDNLAQVRDGKVVLSESKYITNAFAPDNSRYPDLNKTLIRAGLR